MKIKHTIVTAYSGVRAHPSRSLLTILGVVIGITAIIMIVSVGESAEGLVVGEINGLGSETLVIRPGREPRGPSDFADVLFENSLKSRDVELLKSRGNVPRLVDLMPAVAVPGGISYKGETFRPSGLLGGSAEFLVNAFNIYPSEGAPFDEDDIRRKTSVVVIGERVKQELFGAGSAIGEEVRIRDRAFTVVGVFPPKGQVAFLNIDEMAVVPYTTAQTYLMGIDYFHEVIVKSEGSEFVSQTKRDIETTLRNSHKITDPEKDDFHIMTQQGLVSQVQNIIGTLTLFLSFVVAVSLIVGGIGVMNIMLVSVTERTREIGLRKAIGATNKDIMRQFLIEAILLTGTGGVVGVLAGSGLSLISATLLKKYTGLGWTFVFPVYATILGIAVAMVVGLVFGLYPAYQASKKSPIEALRYE